MKIFLTGAEGQLGKELQRRLQGSDYLPTDVKELDITDASAVADMIGRYRPDVVIHGAAFTQVDAAGAIAAGMRADATAAAGAAVA